MSDFIYPKRVYSRGGAVSHNLYDVIPKSAKLKHGFNFGSINGTWDGCPFEGVSSNPPSPTNDSIFSTVKSKHPWDVHSAASDYLSKLESVISQYWNPSVPHIVYHSSGYDSRIISSTISRLHKRLGDDWLGDIVFVSNKWESEGFRSIMDILGYSSSAIVWREHVPSPDYFSPCFDFSMAWKWLNSPCPIPVSLWSYLINDLGLDNAQGISGYWANETVDCFLTGGREWLNRAHWYPNTAMASFPFPIQMMFPFTHRSLLAQLPKYGLSIGTVAFRKAVADISIPEAASIPNPSRDDRNRAISDRIRNKVASDYRSSWYGRTVHKFYTVPTTTEFNNWWGHWSMASLCEHLRANGYGIKY